ncbi:MAG TPA: hypothetical protein VFS60_07355, partial [Thermoanaerobaculia bacterium]|nr:hypothetical protein [Thermoanaerobaculia bacterium]
MSDEGLTKSSDPLIDPRSGDSASDPVMAAAPTPRPSMARYCLALAAGIAGTALIGAGAGLLV